MGFKNHIKYLKSDDCSLETNLFRTAHVEEKIDDVQDDDDNFGVSGGEQVHQWL